MTLLGLETKKVLGLTPGQTERASLCGVFLYFTPYTLPLYFITKVFLYFSNTEGFIS